jgi:hypothetical protein
MPDRQRRFPVRSVRLKPGFPRRQAIWAILQLTDCTANVFGSRPDPHQHGIRLGRPSFQNIKHPLRFLPPFLPDGGRLSSAIRRCNGLCDAQYP